MNPPAREWLKALADYREPSLLRSLTELVITATPFVILWVAAWWALSYSYWLTLALSVPAVLFLVRLFLIQHDCGHGSFFRQRKLNDWVGRTLGVVTLTPYEDWRHSHAVHHASTGNLERRGIGDIITLTVREYEALSWRKRLGYRLYRNPIVMFIIGPAYLYLIRNRLPVEFTKAEWRYWLSAMGTNLAIALVVCALIYAVGAGPFFMVHLPITLLAASIGVWLFYVQHQFEDTSWAEKKDWNLHEAALYGSSHYELPAVLRWFSANIGVHHVHHLSSRIPYYRLQQVLRDYPELATIQRLTLAKSFATVKLKLWDENRQKLVSFAKAHGR